MVIRSDVNFLLCLILQIIFASGVAGMRNGPRLQSHRYFTSTIAKRVLKAQEILPLLPDGHVKRHDLLSPSSMTIREVCLSNNVTSGIAISTSNKPDNR